MDMAAHDIDIVNWLFGVPQKLTSVAGHAMAEYESVYSICTYPGLSVLINCDWGLHSTFKFRYGYEITFEKAHIECLNGKITVHTDEKAEEITFEKQNRHKMEAEEFLNAIMDDSYFKTIDTESVFDSMKLLFDIKESAQNG